MTLVEDRPLIQEIPLQKELPTPEKSIHKVKPADITDEEMIEAHKKRVSYQFWSLESKASLAGQLKTASPSELITWLKSGSELKNMDILMTYGFEETWLDYLVKIRKVNDDLDRSFRAGIVDRRAENLKQNLVSEGKIRFPREMISVGDPEYAAAIKDIDQKWRKDQPTWD